MECYLVRHGESTSNARNTVQGETEELSPAGKKQSEFLAHRFQSIKIGTILTSLYRRAYETARMVGEATGAPIQSLDILHERRLPSEIIGKSRNDPEVRAIRERMWEHARDPGWRHSDEENFFDMNKRAQDVLDHLAELPHTRALAATHSTLIKYMIGRILLGEQFSPDNYARLYEKLVLDNTGITLIRHTDKKGWQLVIWNDRAHLGE